MKRHLVISDHWIGDTIKTQTVAEVLKQEDPSCVVDFVTKWPQLYLLLQHNPYIDNVVLVADTYALPLGELRGEYDTIRRNSGVNWTPVITPGELYQTNCGIVNPKKSFKVYTDPDFDSQIKEQIDELRSQRPDQIVVAVDLSWRGRKSSSNAIEPIDIMSIVSSLQDDYILLPVGIPVDPTSAVPVQVKSAQGDVDQSCREFKSVASVIKNSDVLLASESGILNLGIGIQTTPIIYARDFLYHLAGPDGFFGKSDTPEMFMGAQAYEGVCHVEVLDPNLNDLTYLPHIKQALINIQNHLKK